MQSALSRVRPGDHACLLYESDDEKNRIVAAYISGGLTSGSRVTHVLHDTAPEAFVDKMLEHGADVRRALSSGQLRLLRSDEVYAEGGAFEASRTLERFRGGDAEDRRLGFATSRVSAEMEWALEGTQGDAFLDYEARVNPLLQHTCTAGLCLFDARRFPSSLLAGVIRSHPLVIYADRVLRNVYYERAHDDAPSMDAAIRARLGSLVEMEQNREAAEANERLAAIGFLAAGVAHEVNNPLTYIAGAIEFAAEEVDALDEDLKRGISNAQSGTARLDRIREHLATGLKGIERVSKITRSLRVLAQPPTTERCVVDVQHVVDDALGLMLKKLPPTIELVRRAGAPALRVPVDRDAIMQVIVNLVINAAQAMEGQARGTITVETHIDHGDAVIRVMDGPGIPPDARSHIFDPLFTTKPEGTGLGLSLARTTVQNHGGSIHLDTRAGPGASFTLRLPISKEPSP